MEMAPAPKREQMLARELLRYWMTVVGSHSSVREQ